MELTPGQILAELSTDDRQLLNAVFEIETRRIHVQEIKANTLNEREIVAEIVKVIDQVVNHAD